MDKYALIGIVHGQVGCWTRNSLAGLGSVETSANNRNYLHQIWTETKKMYVKVEGTGLTSLAFAPHALLFF